MSRTSQIGPFMGMPRRPEHRSQKTELLTTYDQELERKRKGLHAEANNNDKVKRPRTDDDKRMTKRVSNRSSAREADCVDISSLDPDSSDDLKKFLGFADFNTTKNKKVPGNNVGAVDIRGRRKYEQKLHRKKLYEIPMTRQEVAAKEADKNKNMQL